MEVSQVQAERPGFSSEEPKPEKRASRKRNKTVQKVVVEVLKVEAEDDEKRLKLQVPPDCWSWRKYGQKPIKGSPYTRGYYRCSTSKGCSAKKQVDTCRTDPSKLIITYTSTHNHPGPDLLSAPSVITAKESPGTADHRQTAQTRVEEDEAQKEELVEQLLLETESEDSFLRSLQSPNLSSSLAQSHEENQYKQSQELEPTPPSCSLPSPLEELNAERPTSFSHEHIKFAMPKWEENDFYDELEELSTSLFVCHEIHLKRGFL